MSNTYDMTIAGVSHPPIGQTLNISSPANGRATLTCDVPSADGSYVPALDAEVILSENSAPIFGGTVHDAVSAGMGGIPIVPLATRLSVTDFNGLADQRYVSETIPEGTLKAALQVLVTYLTTYGVTLDGAQATGPTLAALVYDYRKLSDVFNELVTLTSGGYIWEIDASKVLRMYAIGSLSAPFNVVDGDGNSLRDITVQLSRVNSSLPYANRVIVRGGSSAVPITAQADDAGEQAAHNLWEIVVAAPTATDLTTAQALANELLIQYTASPKTVKYQTLGTGLKVGQTQTVTRAKRNINNTFLITDISTRVEQKIKLVRTVTAIEGSVYQGSWRDVYKQWSSGVSQVVAIPSVAGPGRQAYFLGGSAIEYVDSGAPEWVPIDGTVADPGTQVTLDTAARGSTAVTVRLRLRATAGTVQARLRDVSNGLTVGTSSVVSTTTFQTVSFAVTLTNGAYVYQIELLGSLASTDIAGIAYCE